MRRDPAGKDVIEPPKRGAPHERPADNDRARLSLNFDLPANYEPPKLEFVNIADITSKQYAGVFAPDNATSGAKNNRSVVAFHDSSKRTIFIAEGWTGKTPVESSVLVHKMVHHLQNLAGQTYNCPEEREQLAYQAQERWLSQMGRSIHTEFQIDPFTLLFMTHCLN